MSSVAERVLREGLQLPGRGPDAGGSRTLESSAELRTSNQKADVPRAEGGSVPRKSASISGNTAARLLTSQ